MGLNSDAVRAGAPLALFLTLCVLLGGASAAGVMANFLLQLVAVALLAWSFARRGEQAQTRDAVRLAWFGWVALAVATLQLIPLPPAIWTALPGREQVAAGFALIGLEPGWAPLSLTPQRTVAAGLALLAPAAAVALALRAGDAARAFFATVLALALLSVLLGLAQAAGGVGSPLYIYEITNLGAAVGFFANQNHLATLALVGLPCLGLLAGQAMAGRARRRSPAGVMVATAAAAVLLLFGVAVSNSIAGWVIATPAVLFSLLVMFNRRAPSLPLFALLVGGCALVLVAGMSAASSAGYGLDSAAGAGALDRPAIYARTLEAARDHLPLGSGLGSFADIYPAYEDPTAVSDYYVNHAHSDYLELLLETGAVGVLPLLLFLAWWAWLAYRVWRGGSRAAKAASVLTGIVLVHGMVDYPLRTAAIAAIFAAGLAIMARLGAAEDRAEAE